MFRRKKAAKDLETKAVHSFEIENFRQEILSFVSSSDDLIYRILQPHDQKIVIFYFEDLVDLKTLNECIIRPIEEIKDVSNAETIANKINIADITRTNQISEVVEQLVNGCAYIFRENDTYGIIADIQDKATRGLEKAETESLVFGPKISFTESISKNLNLIRSNLNDPKLCVETLIIGSRAKKKVQIIYIKDIADEENVNTFRQRITELEVDSIVDSTVLSQMIEDNSYTVFPQFITTELPDRLTISLLHGKIGLLVDRSPTVIIGPSTLMNFFESTEDIYMRWNMGTF
ncbi:spore germination protein, partial [Bacillus haikouensis]|uniref:spore germination protein n=1 Tax=Bacillus haikouensis TaxID=1510468 RepID=UPI001554F093